MEEKVPEPVAAAATPVEKPAKGKAGKGAKVDTVPGSPKGSTDDNKKDINYDKIIPNIIHLDHEVLNTVSPLLSIIGFCHTMKKEESSSLMIEDNVFDST